MKKIILTSMALAFLGMTSSAAVASDGIDASKIFSKKCKMCHSLNKKKVGPAFKDMNKDSSILLSTITNGRKGTMMKSYKKKLSSDEIAAMVSFIQVQQGS
ncbi:MAG: c-type cytochrome [Mariprofundaceae bacterium]|nr:c-type cytochrome [Mariprofundaceae bacterium]